MKKQRTGKFMIRRNGEFGFRCFPFKKPKPSPPPPEEVMSEERPTEERLDKSMAAARPKAPRPAQQPAVQTRVQAPRPASPANVAKNLSPSQRQQAAKQVVIEDAFDHEVAFRFAFLGTGQGGSRLANAFYKLGYRRVAVMNTTEMDFAGIEEAIPKLNLAVGGAAKDPDFAYNSLRGREEEVWDLMTRAWGNEPDYALICVGLGGGTGSGTCVTLVDRARKYLESKGQPAKVGAVVSLPPVTEGQQVCKNALNAFKSLLNMKVSPLVIIDNARINELYKPGMAKLHATANETVSQLFHLFNQLSAVHSEYITFDKSEFAQLLDGGVVVMGAADISVSEINSPADISTRIREELTNNVLASCDLRKGSKAACLFVGSEEVLNSYNIDFFDAGFTQLDRIVGSANGKKKPTVIHRGVYLGGEPGLQCYTMISELEPPVERLSELAKKSQMDQLSTQKGVAAFLGLQD